MHTPDCRQLQRPPEPRPGFSYFAGYQIQPISVGFLGFTILRHYRGYTNNILIRLIIRFKPSKKIFKKKINLPIAPFNPVAQAIFDSYL